MRLETTIDGSPLSVSPPPGATLLTVLRAAGHTGPKYGCGSGDCGCCTVWLDDTPVHACLLPAYRAHGRAVRTIAGLAPPAGPLHPVQLAWLDAEAFQCGYCTAGFIMTLAASPAGLPADPAARLKGNLCRCTGGPAIQRACALLAAPAPLPAPAAPPAAEGVGASAPNRHGPAVVTGAPAFTADLPPPDPAALLHLAVVRAPLPSARIRSIDTTGARAAPGVALVLTPADSPRERFATSCHPGPPREPQDTLVLDDIVRFVGQRVAVVAADSPAAARRAAALVRIDYEPLPAVLDPATALAPGAPVVHPEPDSWNIADADRNLAAVFTRTRGDPAAAFADPTLVTVARTYHTARQQHTHLEPHVATAWTEPDGTLVVRSSTQVPFLVRATLARLLGLPLERIRVMKPLVGGGFGNKQEVLCEDLVALVALRTGRPVQWELTREEEFIATTTRHAMTLHVRAAATHDGELRALELDYTANTGAYGNHAGTVLLCAGHEAVGLYRAPHKAIRGRAVYTHTLPAGAFRGYGGTQTTFAIESTIDELAAALGLDPWVFRRRNLLRPGEPIHLEDAPLTDHHTAGHALPALLDHVQHALAARPPPPADADWLVGEGAGVSLLGNGPPVVHRTGARIRMTDTGFTLHVGTADLGTGSDTTLAQIAATELDVPAARVAIVAGDTGTTPLDSGAYGSATAFIAGRAVQLAATRLRGTMAAAVASDPALAVADPATWHAALVARGRLLEATVDDFFQPSAAVSFAVAGAQVRVHRRTGRVELLRLVQAVDAGTLLNPRICLGQAEGGAVQGLGFALWEELVIGPDGAVVNPCFRDYRLPAAADLPPIETMFFQPPDAAGPFGAKAIGELTTNCAPAAVANAVSRAIGRRATTLPLTPERVWRALGGE